MALFGGEDAESYYDEGLTAGVKGDVERAVRCFEKAISLDRSFLAAYHQLAKCQLRMGHKDHAVDLLRRVVAAKPDLAPAKVDLGFVLLDLGYTEEARKHFLDVTDAQPANARASLGLGMVCFDEGNWDGAVTLAQESREKGGDHFATLFLLGRAARLAGATDLSNSVLGDADALLEKSIEMNPDQPEGYYLRAEVNFAREDFAKALEHYRAADDRADHGKVYTAFSLYFSRLDMWAKQGLCCQRIGRSEQAREMGDRILKMDPAHKIGQALNNL